MVSGNLVPQHNGEERPLKMIIQMGGEVKFIPTRFSQGGLTNVCRRRKCNLICDGDKPCNYRAGGASANPVVTDLL